MSLKTRQVIAFPIVAPLTLILLIFYFFQQIIVILLSPIINWVDRGLLKGMNAIDFFKKYGLEEAKKAHSLSINAGHEDLDLKKLIKSHDYVDSFGGLYFAKKFLNENVPCEDSTYLSKCIADVESCQ